MKNTLYQFLIFLIGAFLITSCEKMDDTYDQFIKGGETIYVGKADSLKAHGGNHRLELSWIISDPKTESYTVYWDNKTDSISKSVEKLSGIDTIHLVIDNLSEGIHYFTVYMYGTENHHSVPEEVIGKVYGKTYQESLLPRLYSDLQREENNVKVFWEGASQDLTYVELHYKNDNGDSIIQYISGNEDSSIIDNFGMYPEFTYRSAFLPDSIAIDTFFTPFEKVDLSEFIFLSDHFLNFSFDNKVRYGDQENQLSILVSTDFSGVYDMDEIRSATWIDITDNSELAGSSFELWGPVNLLQFVKKDKPLYIAFRYITLNQDEYGKQRSWYLENIGLEDSDGNIIINDFSDFTLVHEGPFESGRTVISTTSLTFRGNKQDEHKEMRAEVWAISDAIIF